MIGQNKVVGVGKIVGYIGLDELCVSKIVAADIPTRNEVELVHLPAIDRGQSTIPTVADVTWSPVGFVAQRDYLAVGNYSAGGAAGPRESSEIIVEGAILSRFGKGLGLAGSRTEREF